jgi:hypothetical protein
MTKTSNPPIQKKVFANNPMSLLLKNVVFAVSCAVLTAQPASKSFPEHWGEPPQIQTRDMRPLPGGFGEGSSTVANWIQQNLDQDAAKETGILTMHEVDRHPS